MLVYSCLYLTICEQTDLSHEKMYFITIHILVSVLSWWKRNEFGKLNNYWTNLFKILPYEPLMEMFLTSKEKKM